MENECPICFELMTRGRVRTVCGHRFHRTCIMTEMQLLVLLFFSWFYWILPIFLKKRIYELII